MGPVFPVSGLGLRKDRLHPIQQGLAAEPHLVRPAQGEARHRRASIGRRGRIEDGPPLRSGLGLPLWTLQWVYHHTPQVALLRLVRRQVVDQGQTAAALDTSVALMSCPRSPRSQRGQQPVQQAVQQTGDYADDKAAYRHEPSNDNHANAPLGQQPCRPFGPSSEALSDTLMTRSPIRRLLAAPSLLLWNETRLWRSIWTIEHTPSPTQPPVATRSAIPNCGRAGPQRRGCPARGGEECGFCC